MLKNNAIEQTQKQMTSSITSHSTKLATMSNQISTNEEEMVRWLLTLNVTSTELAHKQAATVKSISGLSEQLDTEIIERNSIKLKVVDATGKLLRLDDKFNHFEAVANEHMHTKIENRLAMIEGKEHKSALATKKVRLQVVYISSKFSPFLAQETNILAVAHEPRQDAFDFVKREALICLERNSSQSIEPIFTNTMGDWLEINPGQMNAFCF